MTEPFVFDTRAPGIQADPYPAFRRLRDEDPAHWSPAVKGWVLTRYADVNFVARSRIFSVEKLPAHAQGRSGESRAHMEGISGVLNRWPLFRDAPAHTRLRRPLNMAMRRAELDFFEAFFMP